MNFSFFIGIDISKKTLDFAVRDQKQHLFHAKVDNSPEGLGQFKQECLTRNIDLGQSLICCEHTGIYSQNILTLATQDNLSLWLESSLRIKRSLGLQRGKNDKIDAIRISEYAGHPMLSDMPTKPLLGNRKGKLLVNYGNLFLCEKGCSTLKTHSEYP